MGIYNGTKGIKGFSSASGYALCGYLSNPYEALSCQAIVPSNESKKYIPCVAVVLKNGANENIIGHQNAFSPNNIYIDKVAEATDKIDAFIIESETNIIGQDEFEPIEQGTVQVARIGSGAITFLPCNVNLAGVSLSTKIYWHTENKELTKTEDVGKTIALDIQILGSVTKGQKRQIIDNSKSWVDCNCVEVKL